MIKCLHFLIFILMFSCFSTQLNAQNNDIKLLFKALNQSKQDTNRVNLLNKISAALVDEGNVYESLKYAWKGLSLSKKINDHYGIIVSYSNLGYTYGYKGDNDMSLKMYRKSLFYSRKFKHTESIIDAYINLGTIYDTKSDYTNSLRFYYYALNYAKQKKDPDLLADIYQNLGVTYYSLGNLPVSLKMYVESLKNYEQLKDEPGKVDIYNAIGNVYADQKNNDKAIAMYQKSLQLAIKLNDRDGIGNAYVNLGIIFGDLNKINRAFEMYDKAIELFEKIEDLNGLSIAFNSKAKLCFTNKKYEDALHFADKALFYSSAIEEISESTNANLTKANVYIKQGKFNLAKTILEKELSLSYLIHEKANIRDTYYSLMQLDSALNDFKSAYKHQYLWLTYRDSIINKTAEEKNIQTFLQYNFEKKARTIKINNDKAITRLNEQNKLSSQRSLFLIILLIFISLSGIIIWYFAKRSFNNRKQLSLYLADENKHKELLLQEVHHRVNNSLQMISSLLTIQADTTESSQIREYLLKTENRIQSMSIMHELLHHGNSRLEVNMQNYFDGIIDFYKRILESKPNILLHKSVTSVSFHSKTAMPLAIILNELLTNSIKYAFPTNEGSIQVTLKQQPNSTYWIFQYSDNGIGFSAAASSIDPSSLGLTLIRLMAQQMNGHFIIESNNKMSITIEFEH